MAAFTKRGDVDRQRAAFEYRDARRTLRPTACANKYPDSRGPRNTGQANAYPDSGAGHADVSAPSAQPAVTSFAAGRRCRDLALPVLALALWLSLH